MRVLAAEDDEAIRGVLLRIVEHLGFEIRLVENGREALAAIESDAPYSVVLMDCQMPEMDGYEATRAIRELERRTGRARVHVIAMTAHALPGEREKVLEAGMDDYVTKPVSMETLRQKLAEWSQSPESAPRTLPSRESAPPSDLIDQGVVRELKRLASPRRPQFFVEIVEQYAVDAGTYVEALSAATRGGDARAVGLAAHALKGSSRSVGAKEVASLCTTIEAISRSGALVEADAVITEVQGALERAIAALRGGAA